MSAPEKKCDGWIASCFCVLPDGHDGPHECDCGGSWLVTDDGDFEIHALPIEEGVYPKGRTAAGLPLDEGFPLRKPKP